MQNGAMNAFDFLGGLANHLGQWFQNAGNNLSTTLSNSIPSANYTSDMFGASKPPHLNIPVAQAAQPSSQPGLDQLSQMYQQGFQNFSPNTPMASMSGQLAQLATQLPPTIDPRILGALALQETGGGRNQAGANDPFNITTSGSMPGNPGPFVNYANPSEAILGGNGMGYPQGGLEGLLLENPTYSKFRETGDLKDLLAHFTPPGAEYGNPTLPELLLKYSQLMSLFPKNN